MNKKYWWLFFLVGLLLVVFYLYKMELIFNLDSGEVENQEATGQWNDGKAMEVIEYQDSLIPITELRIGEAHAPHATGPGCPEKHWHADEPAQALNTKVFSDPLPGGCGFGTLNERPVLNYFPHDTLAE